MISFIASLMLAAVGGDNIMLYYVANDGSAFRFVDCDTSYVLREDRGRWIGACGGKLPQASCRGVLSFDVVVCDEFGPPPAEGILFTDSSEAEQLLFCSGNFEDPCG